jgi:pimeloyl-ACP methyl ester carboxylesterase
VCRKWRNIVFGSPRRLKLRLCCNRTQRRLKLDVWPLLPIVVRGYGYGSMRYIIAALEHNDRICGVDFGGSSSIMEQVLAAMQQPFPALTSLELRGDEAPAISFSFLGGSAPSLESLCLPYIRAARRTVNDGCTARFVRLPLPYRRSPKWDFQRPYILRAEAVLGLTKTGETGRQRVYGSRWRASLCASFLSCFFLKTVSAFWLPSSPLPFQ